MKTVFEYTEGMREKEMHYCPGCTHGIAHRLIMEVLDEKGQLGNTIGASPVGCSIVASIGTSEIIHAAERGEHFSTFFINNAIYGMTGGQMAPTTLVGQKATTCVEGRTVKQAGFPLRMSEIISQIDGAVYVERVTISTPGDVRKAKKAIQRAFEIQEKGLGFSFVEILSTCPTNWGMSPVDSIKWLRENMIPYYPVKKFKDVEEV